MLPGRYRGLALRPAAYSLHTGMAYAAHCPSPSQQEVDWEVELAVIIGKKGKHIQVRWMGSETRGSCYCPTTGVPAVPGPGKWSLPTCFLTALPLP